MASGIAIAAVLAGCSPSEPSERPAGPESTADIDGAEPTADTGGEATSAPRGPTTAPPIPDPVDFSAFLDNPCSLLTKAQRGSFQVTEAGRPDTTSSVANSSGPGCDWTTSDGLSSVGLGLITSNKNGLSDLYAARATRSRSYFGYFEPTEVRGYPAVLNGLVDNRSNGSCGVSVGVASDSILFASQDGGDGAAACDVAKQVAAAALANLKARG